MAKTEFEIYGVKLTSFEDIKFSMWLDKSGIYMNTLYPDERKKIITDWLTKERETKNQKP